MHEGLYHFPDYREFMASAYIGDSTTCFPLIKNYIKRERKIIIHRDVKEVIKSLTRLFGASDWSWVETTDKELKELDGLHIGFNDINDRLGEIWRFCKKTPFPREKAQDMKDRILNNEHLISEVEKCLG